MELYYRYSQIGSGPYIRNAQQYERDTVGHKQLCTPAGSWFLVSVARFTERLITYLSSKTYLTTHLRPKTGLILKICIKTCLKSILVVN